MPERTCAIDGCDNQPSARGWCHKHYQRWRQHGDPHVTFRSYERRALGEPSAKTYSRINYRDCITCSRTFVVGGNRNNRRYCTDACNVCSVEGCERPIEGRGLCKVHHAQSQRDPVVCQGCGDTFRPKHDRDARYCSFRCYCDAKTKPEDHHRKANAARRALRKARVRATQSEPIDAQQVYERDGWRCGICGQRVGKKYRHPHPRSVSLDHIVPLAAGGNHTFDNVQCSHLACNIAKSHTGAGQMLLFG